MYIEKNIYTWHWNFKHACLYFFFRKNSLPVHRSETGISEARPCVHDRRFMRRMAGRGIAKSCSRWEAHWGDEGYGVRHPGRVAAAQRRPNLRGRLVTLLGFQFQGRSFFDFACALRRGPRWPPRQHQQEGASLASLCGWPPGKEGVLGGSIGYLTLLIGAPCHSIYIFFLAHFGFQFGFFTPNEHGKWFPIWRMCIFFKLVGKNQEKHVSQFGIEDLICAIGSINSQHTRAYTPLITGRQIAFQRRHNRRRQCEVVGRAKVPVREEPPSAIHGLWKLGRHAHVYG